MMITRFISTNNKVMDIILHPYQQKCLEIIQKKFITNDVVTLKMSMGAGMTYIYGVLIRDNFKKVKIYANDIGELFQIKNKMEIICPEHSLTDAEGEKWISLYRYSYKIKDKGWIPISGNHYSEPDLAIFLEPRENFNPGNNKVLNLKRSRYSEECEIDNVLISLTKDI